jgi:hypothetical protein
MNEIFMIQRKSILIIYILELLKSRINFLNRLAFPIELFDFKNNSVFFYLINAFKISLLTLDHNLSIGEINDIVKMRSVTSELE